jgi:hypothetical protein
VAQLRIVTGYLNVDQGELEWCQKEKSKYFHILKSRDAFAGNKA